MKILSLDSSADVGTVVLCEDEKLLAEMTVNTGNTHSESLLPTVEAVLKITGTDINDVDLFACSTGPGSFTGVRIGVATVKGMAYGRGKPCASVSTLEALAQNLRGFNGIICPVMNARRSQVYNAVFKVENGNIQRLCEDRAVSISELDDELTLQQSPIYLCGDGYDITVKGFTKSNVMNTPERARYQSAYSIAACAYKKYIDNDTLNDAQLVPIYLRPSQAERERQERLNAQNNT